MHDLEETAGATAQDASVLQAKLIEAEARSCAVALQLQEAQSALIDTEAKKASLEVCLCCRASPMRTFDHSHISLKHARLFGGLVHSFATCSGCIAAQTSIAGPEHPGVASKHSVLTSKTHTHTHVLFSFVFLLFIILRDPLTYL